MLRLNDPMATHIIHASVLIEGVKVRVQKMSVSPSDVRCELLGECHLRAGSGMSISSKVLAEFHGENREERRQLAWCL